MGEDMKIRLSNTEVTLGKISKPLLGIEWLGRKITITTQDGKTEKMSFNTLFKKILHDNTGMTINEKLKIFKELNPKGKEGKYFEVGGKSRMKILNTMLEGNYGLNRK